MVSRYIPALFYAGLLLTSNCYGPPQEITGVIERAYTIEDGDTHILISRDIGLEVREGPESVKKIDFSLKGFSKGFNGGGKGAFPVEDLEGESCRVCFIQSPILGTQGLELTLID
ncbi:MAG: hypothetical protein JSW08_01490 [archaeon]|nr:MAG: hypothetical protein JSW08_01490 [archaeon]